MSSMLLVREWSPTGQPIVYYRGRYYMPCVWVVYVNGHRHVRRFRRAMYCSYPPPHNMNAVW